jgi:hypothetical protein
LADLDPDPYWECGLGNGNKEIDKNLQIINKPGLLPFERAFVPSQVWFLTFYLLKIFHVKNLLFLTLKFDQDPDPHRSALVLPPGSGSVMRITIWIRIRIETNAEPQH